MMLNNFSRKGKTRHQRQGLVRVFSDSRGWALDNDVVGMRLGLKNTSWAVTSRRALFAKVNFFVDRHQFLNSPNLSGVLSRPVGLNYYHGLPSVSPKSRELLERLVRRSRHISRVRASHVAMKNLLEEEGFEDRVDLIPIGVDTELFAPSGQGQRARVRMSLGIPAEALVIGSFQKDGTGWGEGLEPKWEKGPDLLIATLALVARKRPETHILLTGPARGFVKNELKRLGIKYTHVVASSLQQIAEFYSACDAYLVTSRDEGGPKQVLEALASGIPLVSTPVGQAKDLIRSGVHGWLVEDFDPGSLADQLISALAEGTSGVRHAGRELAVQNDFRNHGELWDSFFAKITDSS